MRKVLLTVVLVMTGACSSASKSAPPPGAALPASNASSTLGAASAKTAVESFLTAVKNQDLQAMSMMWGTENGLAREQMPRDELEKRLVIMQCNLNHDTWTYAVGLDGTARAGEEDLRIELRQKNLKEQTIVTTVRGKNGRWFVKNIDLTKLNGFCR